MPSTTGGRAAGRRGQVLVEVLLMLPIFMLLVFTVMEIGHLSFRTILLHHAAYEIARVGSLTAYPVANTGGCGGTPHPNSAAMERVRRQILPRSRLTVGSAIAHPFVDPQDLCMNYDLMVSLSDDVPMIFPMTGLILGNVNGRRARRLKAAVFMPIERPLFGGTSH